MSNSKLDAVVIGAGHSGLAVSYYLKKHGIKHLVFERGAIGNSWATQRWKSFRLNTPNKFNLLPGMKNSDMAPDEFCSSDEFVACLTSYVEKFELPVREYSQVVSVDKSPESDFFTVTVKHQGTSNTYECNELVIASGIHSEESIPAVSTTISNDINQLHAAAYRNENDLPDGGVLVVGSGQSGVQIAEDLVNNGKKVYLSTSMVARVPRRYRGKDIFEWMNLIGFFDHKPEDLPDPKMMKMKQPQISGVGPGGKTISLQELARKGVCILGKLGRANGDHIEFQPNGADHVKFGDAFSTQVKHMVDEFIIQAKIDAPPSKADPADMPDANADCVSTEMAMSLKDQNITSIIWATGFTGNFSYLKLPVFADDGTIKHKNGVAEVEGVYFLGFPWLRTRKSGIVFGTDEDAKFISDKIMKLYH